MPSKYSIIQYVPDPIADERINIGIIVFDADGARVQFLHNWNRVKKFATTDIAFLKAFATELEHGASQNLLLPNLDVYPTLNEEHILRMVDTWRNSIQLTKPRGSLKSIDALLPSLVARFLIQTQRRTRNYRDKATAAKLARGTVRRVLEERFDRQTVDFLLSANNELEGKYKSHTFDAIVRNGTPYFVVDALSFELPRADSIDILVDARSWAFVDVLQRNKDLRVGVFTLPPTGDSSHLRTIYTQTVSTYRSIGVDILDEHSFTAWAKRASQLIPDDVHLRH